LYSDEAPSQPQIDNANKGPNIASGADDGRLHTIPNAQGAITVALRIPDRCQIGTAAARQLSRVKLEAAFAAMGTANDQWVSCLARPTSRRRQAAD
jgi:hypothetical protein